jgi:DNA-binding MarR family transcriptional regulator/GNAT superfamily N-acetyltransferase
LTKSTNMVDPNRMDSATPTSTALNSDIAAFRRFSRMFTRYIGTLNEGLLNTQYGLAEARVLYEVATRTAPNSREIAEELRMDPGYLSRLLTRFVRSGLLSRKPSAKDRRSAELSLTKRGQTVFRNLNALADQHARTVLAGFPHSTRLRLVGSMQTIDGILTASAANRPPYILRPHRIGDMGWIVSREGLGYAEEYGWDETFEALVARIAADFITNFDSRRERCWIAEVDGQNVGHIFLVKHPDEPLTAKLRLLFVEPSARGIGLGEVLVNECIRFARSAGYRKIVLWTQQSLLPAHRIYQRAGFQLVKEEPHHSFGKDLVGETWELSLRASE